MYARIHHSTEPLFGSRSRSRTGCTWRSSGKRKHQGIVDGNMTCADAVGGSTCPRGGGCRGVRAEPSKWWIVHGHIDRLELDLCSSSRQASDSVPARTLGLFLTFHKAVFGFFIFFIRFQFCMKFNIYDTIGITFLRLLIALEFEINTKCRRREYNFELQMKERGEGKENNNI